MEGRHTAAFPRAASGVQHAIHHAPRRRAGKEALRKAYDYSTKSIERKESVQYLFSSARICENTIAHKRGPERRSRLFVLR
jgi:hypothetical protein